MAKIKKTNAMRILDKHKIDYDVLTYDISDGKIDGISVANKIARLSSEVYKTLVTRGSSKELYIFVIPVSSELDLKKAATVTKEKKNEMIAVKEILTLTGYIKGGCSPVGMKKLYKTFIDISARDLDSIIVSGGKIGIQVQLSVDDLVATINGQLAELTK